MCDYSLQNVRSRPAKVGDKLTTRDFGTVTRGFAAAEDVGVAVCVLPGTELAFANAVAVARPRFIGWKVEKLGHTTAIFRQVNKNEPMQHHDALEFPDGRIVLLTTLSDGPFCLRSVGTFMPRGLHLQAQTLPPGRPFGCNQPRR